ncbi:galactose-3-O-sulfotransferase 2-like [Branchiostoma lanceolatum]|uniref:galactose-3-O-sulfotransferase 2-like n=1 Tax=Branchiostoma lanceolatum TaxID=7740 RepID=UPI003454C5AA
MTGGGCTSLTIICSCPQIPDEKDCVESVTMSQKPVLVFVIGVVSLLFTMFMFVREQRKHGVAYHRLSTAGNSIFEATRNAGLRQSEELNSSSSSNCSPRKDFVWIKVHKSGSSTTTPLFQQYAFFNNLTVMMPAHGGPILSWPIPPREGLYVRPRTGCYNALYQHSRYNKTWLEARFPPETAYLAIIREPFSHFKSSFNYYHMSRAVKTKKRKHTNTSNPLKTFLDNPWSYKTEALSYGVRFDKTRNAQAFDLGYPLERSDDLDWAARYIDQLERDFLLVIILEHLEESIVLLRRLMCWELQDVIIRKSTRNSRDYPFKHYQPTRAEMTTYRQYSAVDFMMFERFNQSLWSKIRAQGHDFFEEVRHYRSVCAKVEEFCEKKDKSAQLTIPSTRWNPTYTFDLNLCRRIGTSAETYRNKIWNQLGYGDKIKIGMIYNVRMHHGMMRKQARENSKGRATNE